jgi:hypothetical protein
LFPPFSFKCLFFKIFPLMCFFLCFFILH